MTPVGRWIDRQKGLLMIKLMSLMLALMTAMSAMTTKPKTEDMYPLTTIVIVGSEEAYNGRITVRDFNGNYWQFDDNAGDWEIDDIASLIIDSKGTELIADDVVVKAHYSGWISGFGEYWDD